MNFENFGPRQEKNQRAELEGLNQMAMGILAESSPDDRATFADLKRLENDFFSQAN